MDDKLRQSNSDDASDEAIPSETKADVRSAEIDGSECLSVGDKRKAAKKRLPMIASIKRRTTLNYFLYGVAILLFLWIMFFVGLNVFYGSMLTREVRDLGSSAVAAIPKRNDDNSMELFFKFRLSEIALSNSVEIIVFEEDGEGGYKTDITLNALEGEYNTDAVVFDSIIDSIDVDGLFVRDGSAEVLSTPRGKYICYGNSRIVESVDGGNIRLFLMILRPYDIYNSSAMKVVYTLIICSVIVLALSFVFAFFASNNQTKRLTDFSNKAKMIADGDYSIEFSGGGFDEFENLAHALNAAKNHLQASEKLQRDIIANVSHDIRTPLTMIRAYAEMLGDMPLDENKRRTTADIIIAESDRLTALIDDVLNYSKLQSGVAEFKFENVDIGATASSVLSRFDIFRERNGIKFSAEIERKTVAYCDQQRIEQVLYNLITNAVNYCGEDKEIVIRVMNRGDVVRVEVTDHGQGIAEDELESVWDRYYRAARSKRSAVGSGLGLSICKNILTSHGADYGVESELGKGSTFWFELGSVKK